MSSARQVLRRDRCGRMMAALIPKDFHLHIRREARNVRFILDFIELHVAGAGCGSWASRLFRYSSRAPRFVVPRGVGPADAPENPESRPVEKSRILRMTETAGAAHSDQADPEIFEIGNRRLRMDPSGEFQSESFRRGAGVNQSHRNTACFPRVPPVLRSSGTRQKHRAAKMGRKRDFHRMTADRSSFDCPVAGKRGRRRSPGSSSR